MPVEPVGPTNPDGVLISDGDRIDCVNVSRPTGRAGRQGAQQYDIQQLCVTRVEIFSQTVTITLSNGQRVTFPRAQIDPDNKGIEDTDAGFTIAVFGNEVAIVVTYEDGSVAVINTDIRDAVVARQGSDQEFPGVTRTDVTVVKLPPGDPLPPPPARADLSGATITSEQVGRYAVYTITLADGRIFDVIVLDEAIINPQLRTSTRSGISCTVISTSNWPGCLEDHFRVDSNLTDLDVDLDTDTIFVDSTKELLEAIADLNNQIAVFQARLGGVYMSLIHI